MSEQLEIVSGEGFRQKVKSLNLQSLVIKPLIIITGEFGLDTVSEGEVLLVLKC